MALILILILTLTNSGVFSFNFEVREFIAKRGAKGSYFGYSVAQHITDSNEKWLLVGAPLGQNKQPETNNSGALFKCPLSEQHEDCQQVFTDGRRTSFDYDDVLDDKEAIILTPPGPDEIKNGQWLGVNVRSQGKGGMVMVCAHRYITGKNINQTQHGLGLCYTLKSDLEWDSQWEPCKGRATDLEHQQFGYCQAGTSLAFLSDGTALIGSPGPYTWRGTMFVITVVGSFLERDKNIYLGPLNDTPDPIDKYSYLGMSVTAGKFFDKKETVYAAGAPRSYHHGQVYFFRRENKLIMNVILRINGTQFASNYGYEVLTMDINNDGYDDLLVAAPFYYAKDIGGAVYVYYNLRSCITNNNNCTADLILHGPLESRFGFSMTSVGDINHDGYNDVAIGAPYENPDGAIYIYLGGKDGLNKNPSQVIKVKGVSTLGYSLSGGMDMDENGYGDLLTGAYDSDVVILFRTRPIIHINITVSGTELKNIDPNKHGCAHDPSSTRTCFSFNICVILKKLKHHNYIRGKLRIEGDIKKKEGKFARISFNSTYDLPFTIQDMTITSKREYMQECIDQIVYLKENNRDILSPIKFNATFHLDINEPFSPILNQTSVKYFEANFQKDCGSDDKCQSKMVVSAGLALERNPDNKDAYILNLGSVDELNVNVNITNFGESAYEAQLFVNHSISLSYIALNDKTSNIKCTYFNDTLVTCTLGNPFPKDKSVNLGLRFESKDNNKFNKVKVLEFSVFVNSTSEELSNQTSASFVAEVKKRAEVKITGAATQFVIFGGTMKGESAMQYFDEIGSIVWHRYQVSNDGPWTIDGLKVEISWPMQVASEWKEGKWLLYLERLPQVEFDGSTDTNCFVTSPNFMVNELNYTDRFGNQDTPPDNLIMPPNLSPDMPPFANLLSRNRREAEFLYSQPFACNAEKRNCTLDCEANTAKCAKIICDLPKLAKNHAATIIIKSRLWNATLLKDFSKQESVKIVSRAKILIPDVNVEQDPSDDSTKAETTAIPETATQDTSIPIWIIIAAVVAGIIFFLILVVLLYKCGFFKRNRVQKPKNTANLQESKHLLQNQQAG